MMPARRSWIKAIASAFVLLAAPALLHAQAAVGAGLTGTIRVDGSSTVFPITEAVAEGFKKTVPSVDVTVGISGTGGGFKRFCAGETDISNASRPIKQAEVKQAEAQQVAFVEVPIAYDGLSIVVHPDNSWVDHLTLDEVRAIYLDKTAAKKWSDVRPGWPDQPIKVFAPGTDSGTFDYFKEVVAGEKNSIRGDMSVSENDNVLVKGVAGDMNAIGFFGCAFYFANRDKLKSVPIDAGSGPVAPTHDTIEKGTYAPFSRPLFIYINRRALERAEVKAFASYYLQNAARLAEGVGYVRLPQELYRRAAKNVTAGKVGTQFLTPEGGHKHGPLSEIYN